MSQKIITVCGSTRFIESFAAAHWELERQDYLVFSCVLLPHWYVNRHGYTGTPESRTGGHFAEVTGCKEQADELHLRKIDMSDEVLVLNIDGYIGESTRREIEYAKATGKPVRYITDEPELLAKVLPPSPSPLPIEV